MKTRLYFRRIQADLFLLLSLPGEKLGVRRAPAHGTGHLALELLRDRFRDNYFYAGLGSSVSYE